ncbi:MAG: MOSC domain-containing protein [Meiothermus sp.]
MFLASINLGQPLTAQIGPRTVQTGINKNPVQQARVEPMGLVDDHVVDQRHHGGPDQAVYVYSAEDYDWWMEQLGESLEPGTFGENLTFSSFGPETVRVGDRFRVGSVLIEATAPRIPCDVFAHRMNDLGWVKKFQKAGRPGFYARVLRSGEVKKGDPIERTLAPSANPSIGDMFKLYFDKSPSPQTLRWVLSAPIAVRARKDYEKVLREITGQTA